MSIVKAIIVTILISFGLGAFLVYAQQDKIYETQLEIKDSYTEKYIDDFSIKTFPKMTPKYNKELTGEGRVIYQTELYTPIFVIVKADGYKTKRAFYVWNASKQNDIFLKDIGEMESEKEEQPSSKKQIEREKTDLLPTFKEDSN